MLATLSLSWSTFRTSTTISGNTIHKKLTKILHHTSSQYCYLRNQIPRQVEREQSIDADYLAGQNEIMPKMRSVLVDWLIGVHLQFHLLQETLYTTVAIIDRYSI